MYWHQVSVESLVCLDVRQTKHCTHKKLTLLVSFAWAEMRMVAANIFSRFDVIEVPGQHVDFRQYITMQFADGHWHVKLKPRVMKSY